MHRPWKSFFFVTSLISNGKNCWTLFSLHTGNLKKFTYPIKFVHLRTKRYLPFFSREFPRPNQELWHSYAVVGWMKWRLPKHSRCSEKPHVNWTKQSKFDQNFFLVVPYHTECDCMGVCLLDSIGHCHRQKKYHKSRQKITAVDLWLDSLHQKASNNKIVNQNQGNKPVVIFSLGSCFMNGFIVPCLCIVQQTMNFWLFLYEGTKNSKRKVWPPPHW